MSLDSRHQITIDLSVEKYICVKINQYDQDSRIFDITVLNKGTPYSIPTKTTAHLKYLKPDGTQILAPCNVAGNMVTIELDEQATLVPGKCTAQVTLVNSENEVLNTMLFYVLVGAAPYDDARVMSTDEFKSLNEALIAIGDLQIYAQEAKDAAAQAKTSETNSATSEANAKTSEANAKTSETNAKTSEVNAKDSETIAVENAGLSRSYAVGTNGEVRPNDNTDNSKYYYNQCKSLVIGAVGGLTPMGTIPFSGLPPITKGTKGDFPDQMGWLYNINEDFTSDNRFEDGGGVNYHLGTNVYCTADGKWDCMASATAGGQGIFVSDTEPDDQKENDLWMQLYE